MGILVQVSKMTPEQLKAIIDSVKAQLLAAEPSECVRELMPALDLGYTNEIWLNTQTLTANTWSKEIGHELDEDEEVVFVGCFNLTDDPQVVGMKFQVGSGPSTTRDIIMLEKMLGDEVVAGYFKEPVVYKGKEYVYIALYSKSTITAGNEKFGLIGFMRKPYGEDISAPLPSV